MRRIRGVTLAGILGVGVLLAGCQKDQPAGDGAATGNAAGSLEASAVDTAATPPTRPQLRDRLWVVTAVGEFTAPIGAGGEGLTLTLGLEDSRASGFAGCNRFTGNYSLDGGKLTFGPLAATRMHCTEAMDLEAAYLEALGTIIRFELSDAGLVLISPEGPQIRLR